MFIRTGLAVLLFFPMTALAEPSGDCDQAAFAAVVSEASAQLNAINQESKAEFQQKLQRLKAQRGWPDADFIALATPFVQNDDIADFDEGNKALLANVSRLGAPAPIAADISAAIAPADSGHCAMLEKLRGLMVKLVENTRAKWSHMIGQVDTALEAGPQAHAGK